MDIAMARSKRGSSDLKGIVGEIPILRGNVRFNSIYEKHMA